MDDLTAVLLNCTLKPSGNEASSTDRLLAELAMWGGGRFAHRPRA